MERWLGDHWADALGVIGIILQLVGFLWTARGLLPAWSEHAEGTNTLRFFNRARARRDQVASFMLGESPRRDVTVHAGTASFRATAGAVAVGTVRRPRPEGGTTLEELDALWANIGHLREDIQLRAAAQKEATGELRKAIAAEQTERIQTDDELRRIVVAQVQREIDVSVRAIGLFVLGTALTAMPIIG